MSPEVKCPGCPGRRRTGQLLCRACWSSLPTKLRADLFRTWKGSQANLNDEARWQMFHGSRRVALHWLRSRTAS